MAEEEIADQQQQQQRLNFNCPQINYFAIKLSQNSINNVQGVRKLISDCHAKFTPREEESTAAEEGDEYDDHGALIHLCRGIKGRPSPVN